MSMYPREVMEALVLQGYKPSNIIMEKEAMLKPIFSRKISYMLWFYIIMDFLYSFLIMLVFFIIVFIINQLLLLTKDVLQIEIPFIEVVKLLCYALPNILSLSIPFTTLVACLMSVGHFSTFNEFVAMRANGMSFLGSFTPYILFSILVMCFSLFTNDVLVPWGAIKFSGQYRYILSLNPQLGLEQNSIKRYQDDIIVTKGVTDTEIQGIIILDKDSSGDSRTILADTAELKSNIDDKGIISIELNNVNSLSTGEKPREYNYFIGDLMVYNILLKDLTLDVQNITADQQSLRDLFFTKQQTFEESIQPELLERSMSIANMTNSINERYRQIASQQIYTKDSALQEGEIVDTDLVPYMTLWNSSRINTVFDRNYRIDEIVLYRKLAFPVASVLFILLAFPMGLFYTRSGRTVGFGVGLIISFAYWFLMVLNQSVGVNISELSAFFIIWYPNIIMLLVGIILLIVKRDAR